MRKLGSVVSGLVAIILMLCSLSSGYAASGSDSAAGAEAIPVPLVSVRAASGASIRFRAQEGAVVEGASARGSNVPHLVLRRNGALTDPDERTLVLQVNAITVPPPGVTVTLEIETQHVDPAPPGGGPSGDEGSHSLDFLAPEPERRISVWREGRWIANHSRVPLVGATTVFTLTFAETVISGTETIPTPTDYFRYNVALTGASNPIGSPLPSSAGSPAASASISGSRFASVSMSGDHAFLMENQWVAQLPEVLEATEGAAPDELIVYYLDMVPFRRDTRDRATWLPSEDVTDYVGSELVPQMVKAFRVQTDDWGFPWTEAWTSYRGGDDAERLSVALSDGRTWYHGRAPLRGNSAISIRVAGGDNAAYETLTDGLMSSFHHELFHNLQRNINQHSGGDGMIGGAERVWRFFSEGTAVLASSAGQPDLQFTSMAGSYMRNANRFLGHGRLVNDLNSSYGTMSPYHAAIYWRFLYEQCALTTDGTLDPEAGMQVIRRTLTILYSGELVDISTSTDLVGALPEIIDRALSGSSCSFDTHAESLAAFTRALYALRLEEGRCIAVGGPTGCGFYDPLSLYSTPAVRTVTSSGAGEQYADSIPASFGADFVDLALAPNTDGRPLTLRLQAVPGAAAEFSLQVWQLKEARENPGSQPVATPTATPAIPKATEPGGKVSYVIPSIDTKESNRLGLIITRVDARERLDPIGGYTLFIR